MGVKQVGKHVGVEGHLIRQLIKSFQQYPRLIKIKRKWQTKHQAVIWKSIMLFVPNKQFGLVFGVAKKFLDVRRHIHSLLRILDIDKIAFGNNVYNGLD